MLQADTDIFTYVSHEREPFKRDMMKLGQLAHPFSGQSLCCSIDLTVDKVQFAVCDSVETCRVSQLVWFHGKLMVLSI